MLCEKLSFAKKLLFDLMDTTTYRIIDFAVKNCQLILKDELLPMTNELTTSLDCSLGFSKAYHNLLLFNINPDLQTFDLQLEFKVYMVLRNLV